MLGSGSNPAYNVSIANSSSSPVYITDVNFYKLSDPDNNLLGNGLEEGKSVRWSRVYENNVLQKQTWYNLDALGNVIEERNYNNDWTTYVATKYSYDDNVAARTGSPVNGQFNGAYLTRKWTEGVKDADDNLVTSKSGNVAGIIDETYKYDYFANKVENQDANGNTSMYQYDKLGRVKKEVHPDGSFTSRDYNDSENSITVTDENNKQTRVGFDDLGNLAYQQDVTSGEFINHYEYDAFNRLSGEYNYLKTATEYAYNTDGRANKKETTEEYVWFDASVPQGAVFTSSNDTWKWENSSTGVQHYNVSSNATGLHYHAFDSAMRKMKVGTGDNIFVNVYLPSGTLPSEIMLQFKENGSWEHRAYWGANNINLGTDGTASRKYIGPLPTAGTWTTLVIPASSVGLEGKSVDGISFTLFGGQANWDKVGLYRGTTSSKLIAKENYSFNDAYYYSQPSTGSSYIGTYTKISRTEQGDANAPSIMTNIYLNNLGQARIVEKIDGTTPYIETIDYDYVGNKIKVRTPRTYSESLNINYITTYNYAGKVLSERNAAGSSKITAYDGLGRAISLTDYNGKTSLYKYDSIGRLLEDKTPFENTNYSIKRHYYDRNGNIIKEKVSKNKPSEALSFNETTYEYNNRNMLVKVANNVSIIMVIIVAAIITLSIIMILLAIKSGCIQDYQVL